jgi:hypothetical protein
MMREPRRLDESGFTCRVFEAQIACEDLSSQIQKKKFAKVTEDTTYFIDEIEALAEQLRDKIWECQADLEKVNQTPPESCETREWL